MDQLKHRILLLLDEDKKFLHKIYSRWIDDHAYLWDEIADLGRLRDLLVVLIKLFYEEHKSLQDLSQVEYAEFKDAVRQLISNRDAFLQKARAAQIAEIEHIGLEQWYELFKKDIKKINEIIEKNDHIGNIPTVEFQENDYTNFKRSRLSPTILYGILNPFDTFPELEAFSAEVKNAKFVVLKFDNSGVDGAIGETIKYSFLRNFFHHYFPNLLFFNELPLKEQQKAQRQGRIISTRVIDFNELHNRRVRGDQSYFPEIDHADFSRVNGYSMIQLKPTDMIFPSQDSVVEMRKNIQRKIGFEEKLVITSISNTEQISDLIKCANHFSDAKIVVVQGTSFQDGFVTDRFEKRVSYVGLQGRFVSWFPPYGYLRMLYGVGNYAFVHHNKNKLEPIACGLPAVTTEDYRDPSKNPNVVIDNILDRYGFIKILGSAESREVSTAKVTDELLTDLTRAVSKDEQRKGIPSLKQETQRIFNTIKSISEQKRSIFSRMKRAIRKT